MSREVHVRFCERQGVRLSRATHLVVMVAGTRANAEQLRAEIAATLAPMGLRLSEAKRPRRGEPLWSMERSGAGGERSSPGGQAQRGAGAACPPRESVGGLPPEVRDQLSDELAGMDITVHQSGDTVRRW
jgi:hypothetical protein